MQFFKLFATNARVQYADGLGHSSMAGVRFLQSTERSAVRCMWGLIFLTNYTITGIIVADMLSKFLSRATITVIELNQQGQPMEFPAVFLCPKQALNESLLQRFVLEVKAKHNLSMSHNELRNCIMMLANPQLERDFSVTHWQEFAELVQSVGLDRKIAQLYIKVSDYMRDCYFKGTAIPCNLYFYPDFTEAGYCFVFNNVNVKDMHFFDMDNYFTVDIVTNNNRRVAMLYEHDNNWDLTFKMVEHNTPFLIYLKSSSGTLTLIDLPVFVWRQGSVLGYQFEIQENHCSKDVRTLLLSQRNCLFPDEAAPYQPYQSQVRHGAYNQDICINLCHALAAFQQCKCLPSRYILQFPKLNYTLCRTADSYCHANHFMAKTISCDLCPKKCSHVRYIGGREIRKQAMPEPNVVAIKPLAEREELFYGVTENNITVFPITIGLEKWPRLRHTTNIIFGWVELLSGICGLLFGFSFINFIELIYYFTMRLVCTYHINKEALLYEKQVRAQDDKLPCIDLALDPRTRTGQETK